MTPDPLDFDDWYRAAHPRLVVALISFTGSVDIGADAVDEACMRALARWSRVGTMARVDAWVYRVAINHAKRRLRRAEVERRLLARSPPQVPLTGGFEEIWDAVRSLPLRQRTAVVFRYVADLPESQVGEVMKISRGTVASTLADARRRLNQLLSDDMERLSR